MDERMTLEEVRDKLRKHGVVAMTGNECFALADAIDAHLAQSAHAVDVQAIKEVVIWLRTRSSETVSYRVGMEQADKLTRAIGKAQAEGWKVPTGCVLVAIERGEGYEDVHPELVAEDCMGTATDRGWRYSVIPLPGPRNE